jgi:hypothetical protein
VLDETEQDCPWSVAALLASPVALLLSALSAAPEAAAVASDARMIDGCVVSNGYNQGNITTSVDLNRSVGRSRPYLHPPSITCKLSVITTIQERMTLLIQLWAKPCSLAVTNGIFVNFFSSG